MGMRCRPSRIHMRLGADSIQPRKTVETFRQLSQRKVMHTRFSDWKRKMTGQKQARQDSGKLRVQRQIALLSARPDSTVLNDSIPLFFIGRNRNGFWVAREAAGRCGGLFVFRRSAARFARKNGLAGGGATMLVEHSIELDLPNQGSKLIELMASLTEIVGR